MANTVVCSCVICGNPVETRRATSNRTCSHRCYMRMHRGSKQVDTPHPLIEEPTMKESQRQQDTAEHLRSYIAKHCHRMTPEQVAAELQVPLFAVKMLWPNPGR